MKTLIIDDDKGTRLLISGILRGISECRLAANGNEGYERFVDAHLAGEPFDLICLDINMPFQNGHDTLYLIREYEQKHDIDYKKQVKIIMTSALEDPTNVVGAFKKGCEEYLIKPIDKKLLFEKLQTLGLLTINA